MMVQQQTASQPSGVILAVSGTLEPKAPPADYADLFFWINSIL